MDKKNCSKSGQLKLISPLAVSIFIFLLFAPAVFAIQGGDNNGINETANETANPVIAGSLEDSLIQLRKDKADFLSNKRQEETAQAGSLKEKLAAKRKAALAKVEAARKIKEEKRKAVLIRLIEIQIKQLGNTKERVGNMPNISGDLKTQLNTAIDAAVADLTVKKLEVADAATPEQFKKIAKEIKYLFKSKRDIVKQIVDAVLASKAEKTIDNAERRLTEITAKIAALKAAGQDTTVLDALLATAQSKIAAANTKAGKEDLKGAISDLKEAYKNMKNIIEKTEANIAE